MEGSEPPDDLYEDIPDFLFFDVRLPLLIVADLLEDVAVVGILHDQAQTRGGLIDEGVPIGNHIRVVNRRQDPYFVQSIFFLFLRQR